MDIFTLVTVRSSYTFLHSRLVIYHMSTAQQVLSEFAVSSRHACQKTLRTRAVYIVRAAHAAVRCERLSRSMVHI